jgi:hypothetical protein
MPAVLVWQELKPAPNVSGADLDGPDIKEASPTGMTPPPSMAPRTHVTKANETDCAHGILQRHT